MKENTTLSLKAGAKKRKSVVDRKNALFYSDLERHAERNTWEW